MIFLRKCISKKIVTKEIISLAKRTVSKLGAKERQFKEENRIMKLRVCEKDRQIADARKTTDATWKHAHKSSIQFQPMGRVQKDQKE